MLRFQQGLRVLTGLLLCLLATTGWTAAPAEKWFSIDNNKQVQLHVEFFMSTTCPHCHHADKFFKEIQPSNPWLDLHRHLINEDKAELDLFNEFLLKQKSLDFAVPAIFFCNTHWVGFDEQSGAPLLKAMNYCREQISKNGKLTPTTVAALKQMSSANWYEGNLLSDLSPITLIPGMAMMDSLNPCAVFSIITLFAFLIVQPSRKRKIGALLVFLIGAGVAHHLQQVDAPLFYSILSNLRFAAICSGIALLLYIITFHPESPKSRKMIPFTFALLLVFFTAMIMQAYQQNFSPNLSLIFHEWLVAQKYSAIKQSLYGFYYQFIYLLTLALNALGLYAIAKYYKRWAKNRRFILEFSWQHLLVMALMLIAYPYWFADLTLPLMILILVIITTWMSFRTWLKDAK